jgi:hypothetical protein
MSKAFFIKHWRELYERSDTRKTESMPWFAKRTKLIGLGIGSLMRRPYPDNARLYGLWTFIEILASQSAPRHRGWLVRDGMPLDFEAMSSLMPAIPPDAWKEICEAASNPKIGWLQYVEFDPNSPDGFPPNGTTAGDSPDGFPPNGTTAGDSDPTDRETDRELTDNKQREREDYTPPLDAVLSWAKSNGVDPEFAELKLAQALERGDFKKLVWRRKWESKFERFWKEDGEDWKNRQKKSPAAAGGKTPLSLERMRAA